MLLHCRQNAATTVLRARREKPSRAAVTFV
jgi:hypothetical protein